MGFAFLGAFFPPPGGDAQASFIPMAPWLFLLFIPVLMLVVVANLGQLYRWAAMLTYLALLALGVGTTLAGIGLSRMPTAATAALLGEFPGAAGVDWSAVGIRLVITGLLVLALVLMALRRLPTAAERSWPWQRPIHLTALVLGVFFAGLNLAQGVILAELDLTQGAQNGVLALGLRELLGQAVFFVLLALLGVGLGIRRNLSETLARLKVQLPTLRDVGRSLMLTLGLLFITASLGGLIGLLSPESVTLAQSFNQVVIEAFAGTAWGVIALGLLSGVSEELLYRGAIQPVFGLWATSLLFALHHVQYLNLSIVLIIALALVLGWIRDRYHTTVAMLVHAMYNALIALIAMGAVRFVSG